MPQFLFWTPFKLEELLEAHFEFPFNLIGQSICGLYKQVNHCAYSIPGTQLGI